MEYSPHSVRQRHPARLPITFAAICLPIIAAMFISGGFFRVGAFTPGAVVSAAVATTTLHMNAPGGQIVDVSIQNFAFQPLNLTITVGTAVRWTNLDAAPHTATGDSNEWDTGLLFQGQSGQFTFTTVGTFTYHCEVHPNMQHGTITVTSGGSTQTPTSSVTSTTQSTNTVQPTNTPQATATTSLTATATATMALTSTPTATNTPTTQPTNTPQGTPTNTNTATTLPTNTPAANVRNVSIVDYAYSPNAITIPMGTTVHWTNLDTDAHTVTHIGNPRLFDSGPLNLNQTFDYTFTAPGSYRYFCAIHPFMTGTVNVEEATGTPEATLTATAIVSDTPTNTPTYTPIPQPTDTPRPGTVDVSIQNFAFQPLNLTINVGTTVRWTNLDAAPHTATSDTGVWDSGLLSQGQSYQLTFNTAGTFTYHCTVHPTMQHGTITVTQNVTNTPRDTPTNTATALPTNTPAPQVRNASIEGYAFSPSAITIPAGTTVHWTNLDADAHTVTHLGDPRLFDSGDFDRNHTFEYTFNTPGSYRYFCKIHPFMLGTVNVTEAGATPTRAPGQLFYDVKPGDYFYSAANWLVSHNIISGYSDGTFRPYNNITRAQVMKMVVIGEGWTIIAPQHPSFSDVAPTDAFYGFIETAVQHGIISGYSDGAFRPGEDVTRGQVVKIVVRARGWSMANPSSASFSDVPVGSAFFNFVETAVQHGIISGYSDRAFRPGDAAIRGQIAKIIYLALNSSH